MLLLDLVQVHFLLFESHLDGSLLLGLLLQLLLGLLEFFLLGFCHFDSLITDKHFLFHFLQLFDQFLLLSLSFFLLLFFLAELLQKFLLFFLLQVCLVFNHLTLSFSLETNFLLFLLEFLFELLHLLLVFHINFLLVDDLVADDTVLLHDLLRLHSLVDGIKLLLELADFLLVLAKKGIFGVFVDAWLVLNVLGATGVSECVNGLVVVVVSGADVGDHDCLCVSTEGVLKETRQLAISVRDVACLGVSQCRYNVAESRQ